MEQGERLGKVVHFYGRIGVAVLGLDAELKVGDRVRFMGRHTDFEQEVNSMQIEHQNVERAAAGGEVAVKVDQPVRPGDAVLRAPAGA
jgi:hypothetical protein